MKVGILTLSIAVNYGGILQAYALQTSLKKMGYNAYLVNRRRNFISNSSYTFQVLKKFILTRFFKKNDYPVYSETSIKEKEARIGLYTKEFIKRYINPKTQEFYSSKEMYEMKDFDAFIVGSDQIWRPKYTSNIYDYFLEFTSKQNVKRISYAASFGTNEWEFTDKQTQRCKSLLQEFDAISVRELDAMSICEKNFGVKAKHVLDPTMLLTKEEYISLLGLNDVEKNKGNLMTYILDINDYKKDVINQFASNLNLEPFDLSFDDKNADKIKPAYPVEAWLRGFIDADFIITDSFHGTVFSILFNKPFLTIGNKNRGLSRFNTLLSIFNLEERMIYSIKDIETVKLSEIDWDKVNDILIEQRAGSLDFLRGSLNS